MPESSRAARARREANRLLRAANRLVSPDAHYLRLPEAAVWAGPPAPSARPLRKVRRARRPWHLPGSRRAVALAWDGVSATVRVEGPGGHRWLPCLEVFTESELKAWCQSGFTDP